MESLVAGIQNGANAIYLGGSLFSARASAKNFDLEELKEAIFYAHFRGAKVYVTVNTILDDKELEACLDYVTKLSLMGVDGLIVQDLGLVKLCTDYIKDLPLHGSTQMTINSLEGARVLENLGFERVVLARETPLEEIKLIKDQTSLDIEVFAHGALCVSYSGQCLMSSMIGARSGNRGRCAQPCRKSYSLIGPDKKPLRADRAYYISPRDLNTSLNLDQLVDLGVDSIKLEGRMKRPDYVATITRAYRQALDGTKPDQDQISQAFNRGFTKGLNMGDFGKIYINHQRQNNQGLIIGRVNTQNRGRTQVSFDRPINKDDLLEFETISAGPRTFQAPRDFQPGQASFIIPFDVKEKSQIRRIIDSKQVDRAKSSYEKDRLKRSVDFFLEARLGLRPRLIARSKDLQVETRADQEVQEAKNAPLTQDKIRDQLDRLGNTSYKLGQVEIKMDANIFMPLSQINQMRQEAIDLLNNSLVQSYTRPQVTIDFKKEKYLRQDQDLKLALGLARPDQVSLLDLEGVSEVYLDFIDPKTYKDLKDKGIKVYYRTPNILHHKDYKKIKKDLEALGHRSVLIDNLGGLEVFKGYDILGGIGLNVFNSQGARLVQDLGAKRLIASPELTLDQIKDITSFSSIDLVGTAYGQVRVMTMVHCPFSIIKGCTSDKRPCQTCNFARGHFVRDELNVDFPIIRQGDYSYIYNAYPISMVNKLGDMKSAGIGTILLDLQIEERPEDLVHAYKMALKTSKSDINEKIKNKYGNFNYGHYYRGID